MSRNPFRNTTYNTRVVGVDDGAFPASKKLKQHALLVAVLFQGLQILGFRMSRIEVDGRDANKILTSLLRRTRFHVVMLSGISFGGFNVVDIAKLSAVIGRPVMAISGDKPDNDAVRNALRGHFGDWKERWGMVQAAGRIHRFKPLRGEPPLYFEVRGAQPRLAKKWITATATISRLPEPIRVARILARGLSDVT
jgi:hypothetical protein